MKRLLLSLLLAAFSMLPALSMDYEEARRQAWFLTDKMAYELNLTPDQYDRAYQINLDYLMSIRTASDCDGYYWRYRDADFRCVLFDWQYSLFSTLDYFFRPIRWVRSAWYYPVCDHYRAGYYYFDRPTVYVSYRGGMWNRRGHESRSPYYAYRPQPGYGMRNHYSRPGGGAPAYGRPDGRPGRPEARPGRPDEGKRPEARPDGGQRPGNRPGTSTGPSRPDRNDGNATRPGGRPNGNGGSAGQRPSGNRGNAGQGASFRPSGGGAQARPATNRPSRSTSGNSAGGGQSHTGRVFGR